MNINEPELIEHCINGSKSAWEQLYCAYISKVRAFVSAFKFSESETEDICQEVFIDLFKSLPSFRGESSLKTFLLRISKYRCISLFRIASAQKRGGGETTSHLALTDMRGEDDGVLAKDESPSADELLIRQEESAELLHCIEKLSEDCQKIIRRRFFGELSYNLLCKEFDMPLGTLCSKLKRCLGYLKKIYEKKDEKKSVSRNLSTKSKLSDK